MVDFADWGYFRNFGIAFAILPYKSCIIENERIRTRQSNRRVRTNRY